MAAPHVAGAVAQLRGTSTLSADQTVHTVLCMASINEIGYVPSDTVNRFLYAGTVMTNAYMASCSFAPPPPSPIAPPPYPPGATYAVQVAIYPDYWPEETSWTLTYGTSAFSGLSTGTTLNIPGAATVTFTLIDSYGDGMMTDPCYEIYVGATKIWSQTGSGWTTSPPIFTFQPASYGPAPTKSPPLPPPPSPPPPVPSPPPPYTGPLPSWCLPSGYGTSSTRTSSTSSSPPP
eukprot:7386981-Prymnesium_polylepis.1